MDMSKLLIPLGAIAIILFLLVSMIGGSYNSLVRDRNEVQTQQAQVETQLQRRFDLIPNLVNSVKGAQIQEQKVFGEIANARTHYAGTQSGTPERVQAANQYEGAIGKLLAIVENYPQLTSNQTIQDLMTELEGSENRISVARQRYNDSALQYKNHVETLPGNILAGMFGFKALPLFTATPGAQTAPKVNLNQ